MNSAILDFAWVVPHGIALAVGLALVVVNWPKYPAASTLAFLALCLIGLSVLSGLGMSLGMRALHEGRDVESAVRITRMVGLMRTIVDALGTALLVFAVYAGRQSAPPNYGAKKL
jgi:hypothetical protein